jgi:hypothetical protein
MKQEVFNSVKNWLYKQTEGEIQEVLVDMMIISMEEPLMTSLPDDRAFQMVPPFMIQQVKEQITQAVKAQTLVCLRALINANKDNSKINQLIVRKHFQASEQEQGLEYVDKYSEAYAQEVEAFYQRIQASDFNQVVTFN